tara:strand:- start:1975 stop:3273 length:1299 start_codon:yes stop_codon:yes gene_type:complete
MLLITSFQIISVPIFIKFWGVEFYGEWIILNALTAYFSMTDIGINTATANEYSFKYAQGKYIQANILLNNNILFILIAFSILLSFLLLITSVFDITKLLSLELINSKVAKISLIVLFLQVFIGVMSNTLNTIYRAKGEFSRGMNIDNFIRLGEYIVTVLVLILNYSILELVISVFVVKFLAFLIKVIDSKKIINYKLSLKFISYKEFIRIIKPSISFLSFPIANSILLQGYLLIINSFLGSTAVVVFKTVRTMVFLMKAAVGLINSSLWPEFAVEFGKNKLQTIRKMHRFSVKSSVIFTIFLSIFLLIFGENIYYMWIGNEIEFNTLLFHLLLLSVILNSIWNSSVLVLQATNEHQEFSILYVVLTLISLTVAYIILLTTSRIELIPLSLYITDLILIIYVFKKSLKIVDDDIKNLIFSLKFDLQKLKSYIF